MIDRYLPTILHSVVYHKTIILIIATREPQIVFYSCVQYFNSPSFSSPQAHIQCKKILRVTDVQQSAYFSSTLYADYMCVQYVTVLVLICIYPAHQSKLCAVTAFYS
jgi:hypothetical protein